MIHSIDSFFSPTVLSCLSLLLLLLLFSTLHAETIQHIIQTIVWTVATSHLLLLCFSFYSAAITLKLTEEAYVPNL